LVKKQNDLKEIHRRLKDAYGDGAMKWTQVYWWVSEIQRGREDMFNSHRPGWP
jgi:hypothetical protein